VSTYRYSEATIEAAVTRFRRQRIWFVVIGCPVLVLAGVATYRLWSDPPATRHRALEAIVVAIFALLVEHIVRTLWRWRTAPAKLEDSYRTIQVTVTPESVTSTHSKFSSNLSRSEIVRAEADSRRDRFVVCTANRQRRLMIPHGLDKSDELRREIESMGIPISTESQRNWVDFVPALLFVGVVLCSVLSTNPLMLRINVVVAFLVSLRFFYILNANSDLARFMGWKRWAAFLPLLFATAGLWLTH
jgi:hypothetical protein